MKEANLSQIGCIEFINSLPVDWALLQKKIPSKCEVFTAAPEELNQRLLADNFIDVSAVSALFYAQNQDRLLLVPDLSISSESSVDSVLLISKKPISQLNENDTILVTSKGRTTPALLRILCEVKHRVFPRYVVANADPLNPLSDLRQHTAALLIGDDALRYLAKGAKDDLSVSDLALEWTSWTGLPFVFALWVCKKQGLLDRYSKTMNAIAAVYASRNYGLSHMDEVINYAIEQSALPRQVIEAYFRLLRYDLNEKQIKGMQLYFEYTMEIGELDSFASFETVRSMTVSGV